MQNNNRKNTKNKGFYILLAVCVLAIGVSGYFFFTDAAQEQEEITASMSVPNRALPDDKQQNEQPDPQKPSEQAEPAQAQIEDTVMPVSGDVLQGYAMEVLSYNETTRDWRTHGGVDLAAELGINVLAARAGTVMAVYEDTYLGMTVALQHADGYTTSYSGLAKEVSVAAGEQVQAGQVLGTVGESALIETALEPHLHFEVTCNGEAVDPAGFLYN